MFDWFKTKEKIPTNIVPFPDTKLSPTTAKEVAPMPAVNPPKEEKKSATIFYRFGITNDNRLALQVGYSEITMNRQGVQNLIDQLTFFRDQLVDEEDEE